MKVSLGIDRRFVGCQLLENAAQPSQQWLFRTGFFYHFKGRRAAFSHRECGIASFIQFVDDLPQLFVNRFFDCVERGFGGIQDCDDTHHTLRELFAAVAFARES